MINERGMEYDIRPWGRYDCLEDADDCKVKRIIVKPGQRNSYQRHEKRAEFWIIVSGSGRFLIDDEWMSAGASEVVHVPMGSKHRWHNPSEDTDLVLIEVQTGTYFGEDDEERLEDDYGRAGTTETCVNGKLI